MSPLWLVCGTAVIVVSHDPDVAARAHLAVRRADGRLAGETGGEPRAWARERPRRRPRRSPWSASALAAVFASLRGGGYRTVLMALAALAAVCTVVAMTGLVRGASERVLAAVTDMGANRITVLGTAGLEMEGGWRNVERIDLTMDDVARIGSHIDHVDRVSPSILRSLPLRREHRILEQVVVHAVVGPPHRTRTIGDAVWDVELGVALTSDDNEHRRQAIVIGPTVREALFDTRRVHHNSPLGVRWFSRRSSRPARRNRPWRRSRRRWPRSPRASRRGRTRLRALFPREEDRQGASGPTNLLHLRSRSPNRRPASR